MDIRRLEVDLGERSYPIFIGPGLLEKDMFFLPYVKNSQVAIVTNETVADIYLDSVKRLFSAYDLIEIVLPDGERFKTLGVVNKIFDSLLSAKYTRSATIVALGGGVVGDSAGFAAACYQRGVDLIQVPTTLLSQVDSSVGGKTAVNHNLGKNMIGTFYQPKAVVIDTNTLDTLPDRELYAGLAEVIKYGVIRDIPFYEWIQKNIEKLISKDKKSLEEAIYCSCQNKASVVAVDEKESGYRGILNFGHTFGHAIETSLGYRSWLHGEAVAAGMVMALKLSRHFGNVYKSQIEEFENLLHRAHLPVSPPDSITTQEMLMHMAVDKKNVGKTMRLVLLEKLGKAVVTENFNKEKLLDVMNGNS